jgi:primary-amine oxidase
MKPQPVRRPRGRSRHPRALATPILGLLLLAVALPANAQDPQHPLDPLTWNESWTLLEVLRDAGHIDDETGFSFVTLAPPDKRDVWAWEPGQPMSRAAFASIKQGVRAYEAVVDLRAGDLVSWQEVPGVHPSFLDSEFGKAGAIALENAEVRAALERRGFTDLSDVDCFGLPLGYFGNEYQDGRRIAYVECTDIRRARRYPFTRLMAGLSVVVDMEAGEVLEVIDDGVVPAPPGDGRFDEEAIGAPREKKAPIAVAQPLGPGFDIDGHTVRWGNWSFHHKVDQRVGLVISTVRYKDGERQRPVLYEGSLSEIFVPYMDPSMPFYMYNFLDSGEFPAGGLVKPMAPGLDCPDNAVFFDTVITGDDGRPIVIENASCLFERYAGDVAWRHRDGMSGEIESRPKRDLVARVYAVLGNYDYNFDWIFQEDGTIQVVVAATGIAAVKAVRSETALAAAGTNGSNGHSEERADAYGRFVEPNIVAVNHDHFFSFRLDLDVDGTTNSMQIDRLQQEQLPDGHPRRSLWVVNSGVAQTESDAMLRLNFERPTLWRVINPAERNHVGYNTSYHLLTRANALSLMSADDYPQQRAGFIENHLWVTPYQPNERYAAGMYPTLSTPGQGLPNWTRANRAIVDTDIVVWYSVGMHHVVRAEDWPVMPSAAHTLELRPFDFFDRNPALDLPKKP